MKVKGRNWAVAIMFGLIMVMPLCGCTDKAATAVDEQIQAIGKVTLDSGSSIETARDAYDALDEKSKENVEGLAVLEAAEAEYASQHAEITKAEGLIDAIGEVTLDSGDTISTARDAYDALSEDKQGLVENYDTLENAERLYFETQYYELVNQVLQLNYDCDYVTSCIATMWDNVGADNLNTCLTAVLALKNEDVLSVWESKYLLSWRLGASWAFGYAEFGQFPSESDYDAIDDACFAFNAVYDEIEDENYNVGEAVREFRDLYTDTHEKEVTTLDEWYIQTSLYADLALEPSGSLASYRSEVSGYQSDREYYTKVVDSYY